MRKPLLVSLVSLVALACGSPPPPKPMPRPPASSSASASSSVAPPPSASVAVLDPHFREHEPPLGPDPAFTMSAVRDTKLANGMRVLSTNTGGGMFAMRLLFEGFASFPTARPPAVRLMVKSLFGGTSKYDAHGLRRVLEKRFATWSTNTLPDALTIDMTMPADDMRPVIDVLADVVQHPGFDQLTLGFELLQLVEQGHTALESPQTVGTSVLMRTLFGDTHAYARSVAVLDGSQTVDRAEVLQDYQSIMDPANATVILAGAVDRQLADYVERAFASWRMPTHAVPTALAPIAWKTGPRLVVVDRPGSVQSQIELGGLAPARASADWYTMQMIHEILGAHRSSRLPRTLVERDASSFSGATHYDTRRVEGDFYWESSVPVARTAAVLGEIDKAFRELGQTAPPQTELDERKSLYLRQLPLWVETAHETAQLVSSIAAFKLASDAMEQITPGIRAVTPDAVRALAQARLAPDHTRAVIVGDWAKMKTDLKALGWGPIELRDASGKLLRTEK